MRHLCKVVKALRHKVLHIGNLVGARERQILVVVCQGQVDALPPPGQDGVAVHQRLHAHSCQAQSEGMHWCALLETGAWCERFQAEDTAFKTVCMALQNWKLCQSTGEMMTQDDYRRWGPSARLALSTCISTAVYVVKNG